MSNTIPSIDIFTSLQRRGFWFLLWRGIFAVLVGLLLLFSPFASATVFGIIVGAWMIVDGISTIGLSIDMKRTGAPWGWMLTAGIIQLLGGIAVILFPVAFAVISAFFILGFMAISLVSSGIIQLSSPDRYREGWSIAVAIVNILFGVLLGALAIINPVDNVVTLAWLAGLAAIFLGVTLIVVSVKVRNIGK